MGWKGVDPAVWAQEAKAKLRDTFRESVQELAIEMSTGEPQGNVPVKTSNLANSVLVQIGTMPAVAAPSAKFVTPELANAQRLEIGDDAFIGYQARYARRINYGFVGQDSLGRSFNQSGRGFVESAKAKWPGIVERAAVKVRTRSGG